MSRLTQIRSRSWPTARGGDPRVEGGASTTEQLALALERLPTTERTALVLRDVEGLTPDAAAEQLGLSVAAYKSRLHRARLRLAAILREETV